MTFYHHTASGAVDGELWAINVWSTDAGGGNIDDAHAAWTAAAQVIWTDSGSGTGWGPQCPNSVTLSSVKTASIDPLTWKQASTRIGALALAGSAAGNLLPPQSAVVVSLRTNLATRAGRGRVYLPAPAVAAAGATGQLVAAAQNAAATAVQHALQGMATASYQPIIWHRSSHTGSNITSVDVGTVFDTQRRRRDKLVETRVSLPL